MPRIPCLIGCTRNSYGNFDTEFFSPININTHLAGSSANLDTIIRQDWTLRQIQVTVSSYDWAEDTTLTISDDAVNTDCLCTVAGTGNSVGVVVNTRMEAGSVVFLHGETTSGSGTAFIVMTGILEIELEAT